jgi:hypothetical protein
MTNRKETLDDDRSDENIVEVNWSEKHQVSLNFGLRLRVI